MVVDPSAEEAQYEEERAEDVLQARLVAVGVAQPLPLEVEPPHRDLPGDERRLSLRDRRLAVLAAIEVVHERVVRVLREGARPPDSISAAGGLALVDRGVVGGADRLRRERRDSESQRQDAGEDQLPAQQRLR